MKANNNRLTTMWNGIEYPSREAAAYANYVSPSAMCYRVNKGYTCDKDMFNEHSNGVPVTYQGVVYGSLRHCAQVFQITEYAMRKLIALEG